jgi:phospholipid transport system substrate-binding protein
MDLMNGGGSFGFSSGKPRNRRMNTTGSRLLARAVRPYVLGFVAAFLSVPAVWAAAPAESFVQESIDKGYAALRDNSIDAEQRANKVRALLQSIVDAKRVAVFTLGPYARGAAPAQIDSFKNAFAGYITEVILRDIADNPKESITVTGSQARSLDDVIVNARLSGSARATEPLKVAFRVRKNAAGLDTIVDLQVEGIWLAVSEREAFSGWLQQHHGDIAGLAHELQERTEVLSRAESPTKQVASTR